MTRGEARHLPGGVDGSDRQHADTDPGVLDRAAGRRAVATGGQHDRPFRDGVRDRKLFIGAARKRLGTRIALLADGHVDDLGSMIDRVADRVSEVIIAAGVVGAGEWHRDGQDAGARGQALDPERPGRRHHQRRHRGPVTERV